ncbi:MAG: 3-dehydroquinate synthase [Propionibacteriaceae bacterium]|jgi:3-dehydroquinate synthase|nr:3-dehydroquinate synthase [Propionibacteriaceae bacterium]
MSEIQVGERYCVTVARDALNKLPTLVADSHRVAVVSTATLARQAAAVITKLETSGVKVLSLVVPDGENAKTSATLAKLWQALAAADFTRNDLVVGVGGGATTDVAGFVAASYLRGIPWIPIPTTVLGMVDAAVGGKTGIDLPEGKNLVGAFHEPRAVLVDFALLAGLPEREVRSGLAEVVKAGFIADSMILELICANPRESQNVNSERFAELVVRAVKVKATVVLDDLSERTSLAALPGREQLNYGHTLGHAIEMQQQFRWRHGEAIAVGMVYAAKLAATVTGLDRAAVELHSSVLRAIGLPVSYAAAPYPNLRALISRDKKTRGITPRFVLLAGLQHPIIDSPSEDMLYAAYRLIAD